MKKITFFIASFRKHSTFEMVKKFEKNLKRYEDFEFDYVFLKDYKIDFCRGCKLCFDKGEEMCPIQDDRDILIQKIEESDGVVFATPNYAFQNAAILKAMIDRIAFMLHRPRYFEKTFTAIVTQGVFGGEDIVKYLCNTIGKNLGFKVSKGCVIESLEPKTENQEKEASSRIKKAADRFYKTLVNENIASPNLFRLMIFRISRSNIKNMLDEEYMDFRFYKEAGWFNSDYYYPVELNFLKKASGKFFDLIGFLMAKHR